MNQLGEKIRDLFLFLLSPILIVLFVGAIYSGKYWNAYLEWYYTKRKIRFHKKHDKFYYIIRKY